MLTLCPGAEPPARPCAGSTGRGDTKPWLRGPFRSTGHAASCAPLIRKASDLFSLHWPVLRLVPGPGAGLWPRTPARPCGCALRPLRRCPSGLGPDRGPGRLTTRCGAAVDGGRTAISGTCLHVPRGASRCRARLDPTRRPPARPQAEASTQTPSSGECKGPRSRPRPPASAIRCARRLPDAQDRRTPLVHDPFQHVCPTGRFPSHA